MFGFCQPNAPATNDFFKKAAVLQKQLGLTDAQTAKIAVIFKASSAKFQKIISDEHGDTNKILTALAPLRAETIKKIIFLLTREQGAKFSRLVDELNTPNGDQWTPDRPRPITP